MKLLLNIWASFYAFYVAIVVQGNFFGGVAQQVEATVLKTVQCGFESHHPYIV